MTVLDIEPPPREPPQRVVLDDVSWSFYEHLLRELAGRPAYQVAYDDGRMEIISPLPEHELYRTWVGRLVEMMGLERDVEVIGLGSTTFRDSAAHKGLEPDECYYVQHAIAVKDIRGQFDPSIHVPPDLAIEVEVTHKSLPREPIYASLNVPELWHVSAEGIRCRLLSANGQYADAPRSLAFSFLVTNELWSWVDRLISEDSTRAVLREFQEWVRQLA